MSARSHRSGRWRSWRLLLVLAAAAAVVAQLSLAGSATGAVATTRAAAGAAAHSVKPNRVNELDCNGWSAKYGIVRKLAGELCTDPVKIVNGHAHRFIDNGWYVGHDEPSVKFLSSEAGSGNTMSYLMRIPRDPKGLPTATGSRTDYGQLSVAPWFGLPICDGKSYPQNACTPDSDTNSGLNNDPNAAGSAFMELQFYPPGFTPFVDNTSCSATKWCAALTIDSLECTFGFATCNNNCIEPVNFSYLQTNGVPAGPPSPQLSDVSTFTPNGHTLKISSGDVLAVSITDPPGGLTTTVRDLTTNKTGYITASAANGFMNTNIADCSGTPFTFHAEYSTASIQNRVPWAALEGGVLMEQEIGHGEVCNSVTNQDPVNIHYADGQSLSDPNVYDTCNGGSEGPNAVGEGPCNGSTGVCQNATTQGGAACPSNNFASGLLCEYADGNCFQQGSRTITVDGVTETATSRANECYNNRFQNGDLDFDGQSYQADWPNGSSNYPQTFQYAGPFTAAGHTYPSVQFETDVGGSSADCNVATGAGCAAPPTGANFYPFWSLGAAGSGSNRVAANGTLCLWNFGNDQPNTVTDLGKDAQYGTPDLTWYGGTLTTPPLPNPEFTGACTPSHSRS
jgi:hypothetical protein